jgi:signal transduction histidine kinase/class 3 adenylate cyclase
MSERHIQRHEPVGFCVGSIDGCSGENARFDRLLSTDIEKSAQGLGLAHAGTFTLAYEVPAETPIAIEGEANVHRVRTRAGERRSVSSLLLLDANEAPRSNEGLLLVEVEHGVDRTTWATAAWSGPSEVLHDQASFATVGPLVLLGWMALSALQQVVAPRRSAQTIGAYATAAMNVGVFVRVWSMQFAWTTWWSGAPALRRALELSSIPISSMACVVFYRWLAGATLASRWMLAFLGAAWASVALVVASAAKPSLRDAALTSAQLAGVAALAISVAAVVRGWRALRHDERALVALGGSTIVVSAVADLVMARVNVPQAFGTGYAPIALAVEILCQAMILSRRDARAHTEVTRLANVARDASDHALAVQERVNDELVRLDALKDAFIANTSHELRTPLNGVIGLAESLLERADGLSPRTTQGLRTILASGRRLDRLVSDLLDLSKAHTGALTIEFGAVDLAGAVSDAFLVLAPSIGTKGLRVVNDVPANFPLARADETRVAQVLHHVIGNALKFTETGEVRVECERREGRLLLRVSDTGPGIAPERVERLFALFEQGDGSATRAHGGTGLGLAFVKKLMDLQGGGVRIVSDGSHGTTAELTFIVAPPAAQAARKERTPTFRSAEPSATRTSLIPSSARAAKAPAPAADAAPGIQALSGATTAPLAKGMARMPLKTRARVLVADDEPVNLERMQIDFEDAGYELVCVEDGAAAVEAFDKQGPFDLVLLDVMMPKLDGLAACRQLRERVPANVLPIVMVTAKREPKDLIAGFEAGASDYLTKPYVRQELLERAHTHLATAGLTKAMQRYVPQEFASLLGRPNLASIELGDCSEKELTILFLDIKGFTNAAERMTSRQVFGWLNDQFGVLVPAMRRYGGFVDKYIGDALMVVFPKGPKSAIDAAAHAVTLLRERDAAARVGIGIHHGPTMLGALGDAQRMGPTVVSDTVNVAARLESLTRRFESTSLVSEEAVESAGIARSGRTRFLGAFRLKGRAKALRIHELLDAEDPVVGARRRDANACLATLFACLERGELDGARAAVVRGLETFSDDPVFGFYDVALADLEAGAASYDGAFTLGEK